MDHAWFNKIWGEDDEDDPEEYKPPKRRSRNRKKELNRIIKQLRHDLRKLEADYQAGKISGRLYASRKRILLQQHRALTINPKEY
jgi:hypothetical protein